MYLSSGVGTGQKDDSWPMVAIYIREPDLKGRSLTPKSIGISSHECHCLEVVGIVTDLTFHKPSSTSHRPATSHQSVRSPANVERDWMHLPLQWGRLQMPIWYMYMYLPPKHPKRHMQMLVRASVPDFLLINAQNPDSFR